MPPSSTVTTSASKALRILTIDPSIPFRSLLRKTLTSERDLTIVGSAGSLEQARTQLEALRPDVVIISINAHCDTLGATSAQFCALCEEACIIVCGAADRGAKEVQAALKSGAVTYVQRPVDTALLTAEGEKLARTVPGIIRCAAREFLGLRKPGKSWPLLEAIEKKTLPAFATKAFKTVDALNLSRDSMNSDFKPEVIAIGSSTGGPDALANIFSRLDRGFDKPILIAQHMPAEFTQQLATRLATHGRLVAVQGAHGMIVEPGKAYIAPGDYHMTLERSGLFLRIALHQGPKENSCRPAVDALFRSVAATCGKNTLALVLTGMGRDGVNGCMEIAKSGGQVWIQNEASSVIWGMPGAVFKTGVAQRVISLDLISDQLNELFRTPSRTL